MGVRDGSQYQRSAHDAERVALDESPRSPVTLEVCANKPERQHVEENVAKAVVRQRIGNQLPNLAVEHINRRQRKPVLSPAKRDMEYPIQDKLGKKDSRTSQDDTPHPSREGREAERDSLSTTH